MDYIIVDMRNSKRRNIKILVITRINSTNLKRETPTFQKVTPVTIVARNLIYLSPTGI